MSILTKEQLEERFRKSRERQEKKREKEKAEKLALKRRKRLHRETLQKIEKTQQKVKERALSQSNAKALRVEVRKTRWMDDERGTNDLYSDYELMHIEELYPDEPGRLGIRVWEFIEFVRNKINEK